MADIYHAGSSVFGGSGSGTAASVSYDNSNSALDAINVQNALDELSDRLDISYNADTKSIYIPTRIGAYDADTKTITLR